MAYNKYKERKARKLAASNQPSELPGPEFRSPVANEKSFEKVNINPPSYNELVANRAIVTASQVDFDDKNFDWKDAKAAINDVASSFEEERMYGVPNGMNHVNVPVVAQPSRGGCCGSSCQQRKAAKAARNAEKRAAKAAANEIRM